MENNPSPGNGIGLPSKIKHHPIADLPFVRDPIGDEIGRRFWAVSPTGNRTADFHTGQSYADAALAYMAQDPAAPLLRWVVRDMIAEGPKELHLSGIAMGFLERFERHAKLCHMLLEAHEKRKLEGDVK